MRLRLFLACLPLLLVGGYVVAQGFRSGAGSASTASPTFTGQATFTGYVYGTDAGFNNVSASNHFFTADTNGDLRFSSTTGPGFTYGGASTVQTTSGAGFASLGALQGQTTADVWDSLKNTANGANCTGNTAAVCVNDPGGFAVADGSGTTVATINAAGYMASVTPHTLNSLSINGLVTASVYGGHVLPARAFTATAVTTYVSLASGGGAGNTIFRLSDGTNICDCSMTCVASSSTGAKRASCADSSGTGCVYAASAILVESITTTNCTIAQPTLLNVDFEGKWQ